MPRGGRREGAGRKPGVPQPTKAEITEVRRLAGKYAPSAIRRLAQLIKKAESEAAQVAACREILDRTYGKSKQPVEGEMLHGVSEELRQFIAGNATAARAFLGFDGEDQDEEEAANNGALSDHR